MRRREFITFIGGAAAAWPLTARAEQSAMPVIGYLGSSSPAYRGHLLSAFWRGIRESGYVEGENVTIEYRFAEGHLDRLPALVFDLVRRRVAAIFAAGGDVPILVAKGATSNIPIVFDTAYDPVKTGFVASLNRPGGNLTGVTLFAGPLGAKRLQLLRELVPTSSLNDNGLCEQSECRAGYG